MRLALRVVALLLALLPAENAFAHGQSTALLQISTDAKAQPQGRVQLDIALVDLQQVIGLDRNADAAVTWSELQGQTASIVAYVTQRLQLRSGSGPDARACPLQNPDLLVDEHADGPYAVLVFTSDCLRADREVSVDYRLLFDANAAHRALASWSVDGEIRASSVLSESSPTLSWAPGTQGFFRDFAGWVGQGIWHIWMGLDHLLFLATLLLPAVVRREQNAASANPSAGAALIEVARIVTAFTFAHSLTLAAGTFGWIHFEARWVEAAIALTVLFGAVNLLVPVVRRRLWLLALGFGLIHGLGFASVLGGLGLDRRNLLRDLLAFNLGVELGQLAVVAVLVPLAYSQRERRWYRSAFTPGAATAIAVLAAVWLYQRVA